MKYTFGVVFILLILISCTQSQESEPADSISREDTVTNAIDRSLDRHSTSVGQLIYVPVYSHIYQQDGQKTFNLTTTLSIRNADPSRSFTLTEVSYYDSKGKLIQKYLNSDTVIQPLASTSFVIEERDLRGGVGANFIVDWKSEEPIIPPVIEAVNISTSQQQGISFLSVGRVLQEHTSNQTESN